MGRAAFRAIRDMDAEKRPEVWANAISNGHEEILGSPDIVVDTKTVFQKKLNALKAHKSQIDGMLQKFAKEMKSSVNLTSPCVISDMKPIIRLTLMNKLIF